MRAWACPAAVSRLHVSAAACECSCDVGEQVKALPFLSASPALPRPSFPLRFNPNSSLFISPISPAPLPPSPPSLSQNVSPCPHRPRPLPRPSHLRYCLPPYCRRRHRRCSKLRVFLKNWIRGDWRSADAERRGAGPASIAGLNQTKPKQPNHENQNNKPSCPSSPSQADVPAPDGKNILMDNPQVPPYSPRFNPPKASFNPPQLKRPGHTHARLPPRPPPSPLSLPRPPNQHSPPLYPPYKASLSPLCPPFAPTSKAKVRATIAIAFATSSLLSLDRHHHQRRTRRSPSPRRTAPTLSL